MGTTPLLSAETIHASNPSRYLAGGNTELKCFIGRVLPLDEPMSAATARDAILIEANGGQLGMFRPHIITDAAARMPEGLIDVERGNNVDDASLTKRLDGHLAMSFGGMVLPLVLPTNLTQRTLVGEHNVQKGKAENGQLAHSIDVRLVVYEALLSLTSGDRWRPSRALTAFCEDYGVTQPALYSQLKTLSRSPLLDKRPIVKNGRTVEYEYRIGQDYPGPNGSDVAPFLIIDAYVEAVAKFLAGDQEAINKGSQFVADVMEDKKRMPYYVKRSMARSRANGAKKKTPLQIAATYERTASSSARLGRGRFS